MIRGVVLHTHNWCFSWRRYVRAFCFNNSLTKFTLNKFLMNKVSYYGGISSRDWTLLFRNIVMSRTRWSSPLLGILLTVVAFIRKSTERLLSSCWVVTHCNAVSVSLTLTWKGSVSLAWSGLFAWSSSTSRMSRWFLDLCSLYPWYV